jgi:pyridoxine 4-dehydrogenase
MPNIERAISIGARQLPRMGLGTNRLTDTRENRSFIRDAAAAGIGVIDTAHLYTGGASESTIGSANLARDANAVVATKGGFRPGEGRPDVLRAQVEESLRRLGTERIFLYYLHRVDPETPLDATVGALADLRDEGKIENVGLSQVSIEQIEQATKIVPIAAVQNHYNLDERGSDDVVDYCARENITFVPFFPLHGERAELRNVAQKRGATPTQIALAWLLRRSPAMLPIPGTLSLEHVRENVGALDIELSDDEFAALS